MDLEHGGMSTSSVAFGNKIPLRKIQVIGNELKKKVKLPSPGILTFSFETTTNDGIQ